MSGIIKIKKGLDIQLVGEADNVMVTISPEAYASKPTDFIGVSPKVLVQEGEEVKAGTPLYFDKHRDQIIFTSPVSGTVKEVKRGAKRLLLEIIIEPGKTNEYIDFGKDDPNTVTRDQIVEKMLKSGVWPVIRQRPYSVIAKPDNDPKAIFISSFDTSPLAPDYNFIVEGQAREFQAGVEILRKLTSGKVHLDIPDNTATSPVFLETKGVEIHRFAGPHPTGNISTQVSRIDPINKGDVIWYLRPQEVLMIGRLFLSGTYDATRIYALTGPMVKNPVYYKTLAGASIDEMVKGNVEEGNLRFISGNVLTGTKISREGFAGFYDSQITVIREGDYFEFFGWATPGLDKFSFYKQFFSWMQPRKRYKLDTKLHGGERAFVMTGQYEKVFPFDIFPMQLIKAIMVDDIELMEDLGIYEIDTEDFALIEFIDTSKTEIQTIVRDGLELMRKETT